MDDNDVREALADLLVRTDGERDSISAAVDRILAAGFHRTHAPHVVTTANLGREVLHHIEIVSSDGLPVPRLVCTAAPGADCRRRPEDDSVEEWGPGYDGPMIDSECWAIDWVNADTFEDQVCLTRRDGLVLDNGVVLARIPVEVKYDEGVTAQLLTPAPAPVDREALVEKVARVWLDACGIDPDFEGDDTGETLWQMRAHAARAVLDAIEWVSR